MRAVAVGDAQPRRVVGLVVQPRQQDPGAEAENAWAAPPPRPPIAAVIPVWRNPWMFVGRDTFTGDLAARLGLHLFHA
ncbi:helical backbone metal receptor, partial [Nocardia farcinica]|uniref:helical backbone metal receptor n=1 Tax=Nocardia farcinica TaxID=37329 RepID=UPI00245387E0